MSKQLVLFFTDWVNDWDEIPGRSGSDRSPYEVPENRPKDEGCALIVFDDEPKGGFGDIGTFLEKAKVDWADEVYVAVHDHQQHVLISHSKLASREYRHEEGDQVYSAFREVIKNEVEGGSAEKAREVLQDLVRAFSVNWLLEVKLEILHRCLTPEGAKTVAPEYALEDGEEAGDFPEEYSKERKTLLEDIKLNGSPLDGDDAEWDVEDVVCALADEPQSGDKELPDDKRQIALTMMRDALLENE